MDEEMTGFEILKQVAEENQTRKIIEILKESKDLSEAIKKVEALIQTERDGGTCRSRPLGLKERISDIGKKSDQERNGDRRNEGKEKNGGGSVQTAE